MQELKKILVVFIASFLIYSEAIAKKPDQEDGYLSAEFHKERREKLKSMLPDNSVAVFFTNPIRNRSNDVDYVYHQDPNFYYLTGYKEPHAVLMLFSEKKDFSGAKNVDEVFFALPKDPLKELWTGKRLGVEGVKENLKIDCVLPNDQFKDFEIDYASFDKVFFINFKNDVRDDLNDLNDLYNLINSFREKANIPEYYISKKEELYSLIKATDVKNSAAVARIIGSELNANPVLKTDGILISYIKSDNLKKREELKKSVPELNIDGYSLEKYMASLREVKTEKELELLKKAIKISCIGQIETMKAMHSEMSEAEVQGLHEFVFKKYGAEFEGYPSIVGAGNNGCILHYITNDKPKIGNNLILMDLGAQYRGYTADVTRTIPANGKFTKEQKAIYELVLKAQNEAIGQCIVGNSFWSTNVVAKQVINEGLAKLGIIKEGESHNYFPHGTSHYIGLDVHDAGTYGSFKAGNIITVEPGIYIPDGSPCDKKWWGIAVRIEDDILITDKKPVNISALAPRKVSEIEKLMKEKSALDDFVLPKLD